MKKVANTIGVLGIVGCAVIASPFAMADDSGWYMGGNLGQARAKIDDTRITSSLLQGGSFTAPSITDDNRSVGYKFFGGYKFNKNFALESGYFNLGKFGYTAATTTTALPVTAGTLGGKIELDGFNIDAVGILPVTEKFSVFGRVGANYAEARDTFVNTGSVPAPQNPSPSKRELNPKIGLGIQYNFSESLGVRVEAERYRINDAVGNKGDIDLISLGLVYRFGNAAPAPVPAPIPERAACPTPERVSCPTPEPVIVVPPPKPMVMAPPPPPPLPKKMVFASDSSADSLFDFDNSAVKPAGKQAIDKFAADLKGANFDVITVTGHTDRLGSQAYNAKLSTSRAEAVKAYLVESDGIPADKIVAKGVAATEPVTKSGECKGKKATVALITCLQPDRRVEVEVTATRTSN